MQLNTLLSLVLSMYCLNAGAAETQDAEAVNSYGQAVVSAVLRIDENVTFYCDIQDFPPVIGKNMPVRLKALKPARTAQENQKLLVFLNDLLFSKEKSVTSIQLKNIERGSSFCLVADMEVDGRDLCDLLVEQDLARRVVEVSAAASTAETIAASEAARPLPASYQPAPAVTYVCSKSSKIYHRSTCLHVKRMDMSKAMTFTTKPQAEAAGRRPCKTCNP